MIIDGTSKDFRPRYEKYTTILRPEIVKRSLKRSISREKLETEEKRRVDHLIDQRRRCLVKNLFFISLMKTASYLFREVIVNNWLDKNLILVRYVLSNFLLIIVTPLFVPSVLRKFTVRSSLRLAVLWLTLIILTTYKPVPYVFLVQILLCTFAESILSVTIPIYTIRIANIWARINGIDIRTTILRFFALHNLLYQLKQILVGTIKYLQPETLKYLSFDTKNTSCGAFYCSPNVDLVTNYFYEVKYRIYEEALTLSIMVAATSALTAILLTIILDRLGKLSKSEFGHQPKVCKAIDVFLQLCRPRMTYLLGLSLYQPFLITLRHDYLEAYANCSLRSKYEHMLLVIVTIAAIHATLSAEILVDILEIVGSLQLIVGILTTIFILLSVFKEAQSLNVLTIFLVVYILQYWISVYGLFVILLTQQLIGNEEIAAWTIYSTIFWIGLTLSQAFRYMCMNTKLQVMIVFSILLLFMTFFLHRQFKKAFVAMIMDEKIVEAFERKKKVWIFGDNIDLTRAIDIGGEISWVETFWRRTIHLVNYSLLYRPIIDDDRSKKRRNAWNFIERRSEDD